MSRAIPEANPPGFLSSLALTRSYLRDPLGVMREIYGQHGPVARLHLFGRPATVVLGPDANELVLRNSGEVFSSALGWDPLIGRTFPNGLISMDGPAHRADRRLIGAAFKPEALRRYCQDMAEAVRAALCAWPEQVTFYPRIRRLTLDLACRTLLGLQVGPQADGVARHFETMLGAATAILPSAVPGGALWRGIHARKRLAALLRDEVSRRRAAEATGDIFSTLCHARDDQGRLPGATSVADHVSLLLMAAHDTTTSALTSAVYRLGAHREWQEALRAELRSVDSTEPTALAALPVTGMFISETLRCAPPVSSLPRGLVSEVEIAGCRLPAGTAVGIHILHTHYMDAVWPEPQRFDPERFNPAAVRDRHRYAWIPFGGGMHMCLGVHFAQLQMKVVLAELLRTRNIVLKISSPPQMDWLPIARLRSGLPVRLSVRQ